MTTGRQFPHYYKDVTKFSHIDVYRVLDLYQVTDPCIQHAIKKLLVAGGRGAKDITKDIDEAIASLQRWKAMREEEGSVISIGGLTEADANLTPEHQANLAHHVSKTVHEVNDALAKRQAADTTKSQFGQEVHDRVKEAIKEVDDKMSAKGGVDLNSARLFLTKEDCNG